MSPGMADALHFHQLIYRRIVRGVFDDDLARRMLRRNNRTSPYLWAFTLLTVVPALLFWSNTPVLVGFCLLFVVSYVIALSGHRALQAAGLDAEQWMMAGRQWAFRHPGMQHCRAVAAQCPPCC